MIPAALARRKAQHLEIARSPAAASPCSAGFDDVHLVPRAAPELNETDICLDTSFLSHRLAAPLMIAGMTGGHREAAEINRRLAAAAEQFGLAIGVGSQRAGLVDPALAPTYRVVRDMAPNAAVIGNLGAAQLVPQRGCRRPAFSVNEVEDAVAMIDADALAIHLNVVEEMVQPEGDRNFNGVIEAVSRVAEEASVPIIAKETGSGIDRDSARTLIAGGVSALDVGGTGGTSFARIEAARAELAGDSLRARLGQTFGGWGIPTAAAVLEVRALDTTVIATGGIRSGLDAAKALALGADVVGVARPFLEAAAHGTDALTGEIEAWLAELRLALLLCGAHDLSELRSRTPVLSGTIWAWFQQRHSPRGATW